MCFSSHYQFFIRFLFLPNGGCEVPEFLSLPCSLPYAWCCEDSSAWYTRIAYRSPPASVGQFSDPSVPCTEPTPSPQLSSTHNLPPPHFWVLLILFSPLNLLPSSSLSNQILPMLPYRRSTSSMMVSAGPQSPGFCSLTVSCCPVLS